MKVEVFFRLDPLEYALFHQKTHILLGEFCFNIEYVYGFLLYIIYIISFELHR